MMIRTALALTLAVLTRLPANAADPADVTETYADIAVATYADSLTTARALRQAAGELVAAPCPETLEAARAAWRAARVPYLQSEVFRFGNPIVDDWEGRVNAWPLDEGFIDYVAADTSVGEGNPPATLNVIGTPRFTLSGQEVDATTITPALISGTLQEAGGLEPNVASGYHAIEFLLWGQDLNGTGAGAGARPATDFAQRDGCTGGNCDRRAAYLIAAADLLVADLEEMTASWADGGAARAAVTTEPKAGLQAMLTGMGSLSYGELAGERMKLGLMLNDPEEEQDCFSDNTANAHYFDGLGVRNIYLGRYERSDGTVIAGPSLADLLAAADPALDAQMREELEASVAALDALRAAQDKGIAYDQMLDADNLDGHTMITAAIDALVAQTETIEAAGKTLGLEEIGVEGSDSLDNPEAVFQ